MKVGDRVRHTTREGAAFKGALGEILHVNGVLVTVRLDETRCDHPECRDVMEIITLKDDLQVIEAEP